MTTTSEVKKILTFTQIVGRLRRLLAKDKAEYHAAFGNNGSTKVIPGALVRCEKFGNGGGVGRVFLYKTGAVGLNYHSAYAIIYGQKFGDEYYTRYSVEATPTQYGLRMHKYLPISLPEGMKCRATTPAIYFNADGTEALRGTWRGSRRGYAGDPDTGPHGLIIRDSDGKFIDCNHIRNPKHPFRDHHHDNSIHNVAMMQGFIPGTTDSKIEWYASMRCPEDTPGLWDQDRVRLLAAKVHKEFLQFSKDYPHCKIAMFPMALFEKGVASVNSDCQWGWGRQREPHVLHRTDSGEPVLYYLPEIVLYWQPKAARLGEGNRFIRVTIPPHGCKLLERGKTSAFSETFRWGESASGFRRAKNVGLPMETVFHSLRYKKQGTSGSVSTGQGYGLIEKHENDKKIVYWPDHRNMVAVHDASEEAVDWYQFNCGGYGMRPDEILSSMKERELLDSLPLC